MMNEYFVLLFINKVNCLIEMKEEKDKSLPPFVKSWQQLYWILVINLILMILFFYGFSRYFG